MTQHFTYKQNADWLAQLPKKSIAVKAIIRAANGDILLVKPTYKPGWQFPGGGVEPNEEPREALVRELHEELGLTVKPNDLKIIGTMFRREHDNLVLVYEASTQLSSDNTFPLPEGELEEHAFVPISAVGEKLSDYWQEFLKENL